MDNLNLVSTFAEFKELKNIDKSTMIGVLEDVFRHLLIKTYETDENFDEAVRFTMDHLDCFEMFMGTHNEESNYKLAKLIDEKGLKRDDPRIFFAQLLGMSDNISFNLAHEGYNVTKYVPYAKVRDVLPYLIRRAEENTSVAGQTSRELRMLKAELDRRKAVRAF